MKNENPIYNNFYLINTLEVNELIRSIKENKNVVKMNNTINYDVIFNYISNGSQLSTVIQEITSQIEKYIIVNILEYTNLNTNSYTIAILLNAQKESKKYAKRCVGTHDSTNMQVYRYLLA